MGELVRSFVGTAAKCVGFSFVVFFLIAVLFNLSKNILATFHKLPDTENPYLVGRIVGKK